jgi:hypothetical protein
VSELADRQAVVTGPKAAWAGGLTLFAGIVLVMTGFLEFSEGLSAVLKDDVFAKAPHYAYTLNLTTWGWVHMGLGVLAIVVGASLFLARTWALVAGLVIAVLSAISNFLFIPQSPWALALVGLDVAVIWAFCEVMSENRRLGNP